jgi:enamine deaminase RidA (YjgF/YER057c/UK114 family)
VHNGVVYLTGQVPDDGALANARTQVKSVLANIDALLARAGSDKSRVLSATLLLTHIDADFAAVNDEWVRWLPAGCAPARTTLAGVRLADARWRVEIVVVAAVA